MDAQSAQAYADQQLYVLLAGIGSCVISVLGLLLCQLISPLGLGLGGYAAIAGYRAYLSRNEHGSDGMQALLGLIFGSIGGIFGLIGSFFFLVTLFVLVVYFVMIILVVGAGIAVG